MIFIRFVCCEILCRGFGCSAGIDSVCNMEFLSHERDLGCMSNMVFVFWILYVDLDVLR